MKKLILAVLAFGLVTASAEAGVLRASYKVAKKVVPAGAKVVKTTAKVVYKVAY